MRGCPILSRFVRKGGQHKPQPLWFMRQWFPPLPRTQEPAPSGAEGMGHPLSWYLRKIIGSANPVVAAARAGLQARVKTLFRSCHSDTRRRRRSKEEPAFLVPSHERPPDLDTPPTKGCPTPSTSLRACSSRCSKGGNDAARSVKPQKRRRTGPYLPPIENRDGWGSPPRCRDQRARGSSRRSQPLRRNQGSLCGLFNRRASGGQGRSGVHLRSGFFRKFADVRIEME
jgi:hypothetical protein